MEREFSERQEVRQKTEKYKNLVRETQNLIAQCKDRREGSQKLGDKLEELCQETVEQLGFLIVLHATAGVRVQLQSAVDRCEQLIQEVNDPIIQNSEQLIKIGSNDKVKEFFASFRELYPNLDAAKAGLLGKFGESAEALLREKSVQIERKLTSRAESLKTSNSKIDNKFKELKGSFAILQECREKIPAAEETYKESFDFAFGLSRNQLDRLRGDCKEIEGFFDTLDAVEVGIKRAKDLFADETFLDQVFSDPLRAIRQTSLQSQLKRLEQDQRHLEKKLRKFSLLKEMGYLEALCQFQEMKDAMQVTYQEAKEVQPSLNLKADQAREFSTVLETMREEFDEAKEYLARSTDFDYKGPEDYRESLAAMATMAKDFLEKETRQLETTHEKFQEQVQQRLIESINTFPTKIRSEINQFEQECLSLQGKRTDGQQFADEVKQIVEEVRSRFIPRQWEIQDCTNTIGLDRGRGLQKLIEYHEQLSVESTVYLPPCLEKVKRYLTALSNFQEVETATRRTNVYALQRRLGSQRDNSADVGELLTCLEDLQDHLEAGEKSREQAKKAILKIINYGHKNAIGGAIDAVQTLEDKHKNAKALYDELNNIFIYNKEIKKIIYKEWKKILRDFNGQYQQLKEYNIS